MEAAEIRQVRAPSTEWMPPGAESIAGRAEPDCLPPVAPEATPSSRQSSSVWVLCPGLAPQEWPRPAGLRPRVCETGPVPLLRPHRAAAWHDRGGRRQGGRLRRGPGPAGVSSGFIGLGYSAMAAIDGAVIGVTWVSSRVPLPVTHAASRPPAVISTGDARQPAGALGFHNPGVWM